LDLVETLAPLKLKDDPGTKNQGTSMVLMSLMVLGAIEDSTNTNTPRITDSPGIPVTGGVLKSLAVSEAGFLVMIDGFGWGRWQR
jgi:hypothetical protein